MVFLERMGSYPGDIIVVGILKGLQQSHFGEVPEKNLALASHCQNIVDFGDREELRVGIEGLDNFIGSYIKNFYAFIITATE